MKTHEEIKAIVDRVIENSYPRKLAYESVVTLNVSALEDNIAAALRAERIEGMENACKILEYKMKGRKEVASRGDEGAAYEADWTKSNIELLDAEIARLRAEAGKEKT